ncbi:Riboflavin transport system permease protein RibX [Polaromonas vacuolata]|uniref:Riboflavin transport system permease protein RibX n=1 Tax=Polaromonas vacuolata TaxID=37448 RepID=A0A6H2HAX8_9BURK|nr:ABC transporter permease [Polaromonas vacuolata]QJC56980.1 Riboflavin transport system permease protein RibX [Polaromonas vacuolata]
MSTSRLTRILFFALLIATWEVAARSLQISQLVLPAPSVVAAALWRGLASGYLLPHIYQTVMELVLGLLLGASIGFVGGVLLAESNRLRELLMPYVVASQVVPKLALAPLFIVWFGFGTFPTVVITALICFFPLLENTLTALSQVDAQRLELFRMLRASRWQVLLQLKIPAGLPTIMAGLRVAVVLALVGAVVGEFVGGSKGLGALIIAAQGMMDTSLMFAVLVLITAIGLAFYQLTLALERYLLRAWI